MTATFGLRRVGWPFEPAALRLEATLPLVVDPAYRWAVDSLWFHPDDERLIAVDNVGDLFVVSRRTGEFARTSSEDTGFTAVAVSGDGRVFVVGEDVFARWDLEISAIAQRFECHAGRWLSLAVAPDGRHAAIGNDKGTIEWWDLVSGTQVWSRDRGHDAEYDVRVALAGRNVIATGSGGSGKVWTTDVGKHIASIYAKGACVAGHPNGCAIAGKDSLEVWRDGNASELERRGTYDPITAVAITPNGERAIVGHYSGVLAIWDLTRNSFLSATPTEGGRPITALAISRDGHTVAAGGESVVTLWSLSAGKSGMTGPGRCRVLTRLDDRRVLASGHGRDPIIWDLETGECHGPLIEAPGAVVYADPDHVTVIGVSTIERFRVAGGSVVGGVHDHALDESLECYAIARRGTLLLAPLHELHVASLVDLETERYDSLEHPARVTAVGFADDTGSIALTGDEAGTVRRWRTSDRSCIDELAGGAPVTAIAAHEQCVLAVRSDGTIATWRDGRWTTNIAAPAGISEIAISRTGLALLVDTDHNAQIWDLSGARAVAGIRHPDEIVGCTWLGELAITACADGAIRAWDRSGMLVGLWCTEGSPIAWLPVGDRVAVLDDSTSVVVLAR